MADELILGVPWSIFAGAAVVVYATVVVAFLTSMSKRAKDRHQRLLGALTGSLQNDSLQSFDDLLNLYQGVFHLSGDTSTFHRGLARFLKEYLVELASGKIQEKAKLNQRTVTKRALAQWKAKITDYIKQIERVSPYAELPQVERSILRDIEAYLAANQKDAVTAKLEELASAIQIREEGFIRIHKSNRWSVPLAVVGSVLTVVFGVISIVK